MILLGGIALLVAFLAEYTGDADDGYDDLGDYWPGNIDETPSTTTTPGAVARNEPTTRGRIDLGTLDKRAVTRARRP